MAGLTIERQVLVDSYGKWVWFLRARPDHAAHYLSGVVLPPHERDWLRLYFSEYKENNIVASRGTSKSFTFVSFAAPLENALFSGTRSLALSASGFRGGKLLFEDARRLVLGHLASQKLPGPYIMNSCESGTKVIRRMPDMWKIENTSKSEYATIPTNNEDNMRGFRAHKTLVDERNTFPGTVVQTVVRPMMNVGKDFERAAKAGDSNQLFQIGTIDYTVRDWHKEIEAARKLAKMEWEAWQARKAEDWSVYNRLMEENDGMLKTASNAYSRYDYTDLLIPEEFQDNEGNAWKIHYPIARHLERHDIYKYDENDKRTYIYTYPVDKEGLEKPLRNGTMDEELWLAEQRNVFINAAGNVFSPDLIRKVAETPIYDAGQLGPQTDEWLAPVMYTCGDPCVLGVDYGRESDHFTVVVFRLGELAEGNFTPFAPTFDSKNRMMYGKTPWNNVIWAEAHEKWTAQQAAIKVHELRERYNVIATVNARGIAMDKGGGGTAVRDELAVPKPPMLEDGTPTPDWIPPVRIFDPEDEDYAHFGGYNPADGYWPGLELLKPTNALNVEWTNNAKALMQKGKVYIAYYRTPSQWASEMGLINATGQPDTANPMYHRFLEGYNGIHRLIRQLLRVQLKVTDGGTFRYVMPGDRATDEGKKDLYSAFIYGAHLVRNHIVGLTHGGKPQAPSASPVLVKMGRGGAALGKTRSWKSIGNLGRL